MSGVRRLDHVAIVVRDTERALAALAGPLGLAVVASEEIERPPVRLTYLDCGNAYLQLVEPLAPGTPPAEFLAAHGEGLHHICFGVDDVPGEAAAMAPEGAPAPTLGSGRGRRSAFVPGAAPLGVPIEVTEFDRGEDVERTPGWLPPAAPPQERG